MPACFCKEVGFVLMDAVYLQADHKYVGHLNPVHLMLPFANHLISVDTESIVKIWDIRSEGKILMLKFKLCLLNYRAISACILYVSMGLRYFLTKS